MGTSLFSDPREANLRSCVIMVEEVLQSLGHPPDRSRVPGREPWPGWKVQKGSASVFILMEGRGAENFLRIIAPVMHLEAQMLIARLRNRH